MGSRLDVLRDALEGDDTSSLTENERNRRRDLVSALKGRREQMLLALKRDQHAQSRDSLLGGRGDGAAVARETDRTAELDNGGIVQMQRHVMREQDAELAELEKTVVSTKHIALAVNEELGLHNRLLDELDEDVAGSASRLLTVQRRVREVLRRSGECRSCLLLSVLIGVLVAVVIVGFRIALRIAL